MKNAMEEIKYHPQYLYLRYTTLVQDKKSRLYSKELQLVSGLTADKQVLFVVGIIWDRNPDSPEEQLFDLLFNKLRDLVNHLSFLEVLPDFPNMLLNKTSAKQTETLEVLPCPFCGEQPVVRDCKYKGLPDWEVVCANDGCIIVSSTASEANYAIKQWNTRATQNHKTESALSVSYQNCPHCNGSGTEFVPGTLQLNECSVCHGKKIIPQHLVTYVGNLSNVKSW